MTDQERIERVEKAIEIVERLTANHEGRMAGLEKLSAETAALLESGEDDQRKLQESITKLERLAEKQRRRNADFSQAVTLQTEVSLSHAESIDELRAGQDDFDRKIAALADAHIRAEEAAAEADRRIAALAESQAHSDRKLDALIDVVRDLLDGRRPGGGGVF
jgi:hypothetical protein